MNTIEIEPNENIVNTAFHEAGHCVAAFMEGLTFEFATIVPAEDFEGVVSGFEGYTDQMIAKLQNCQNLNQKELSWLKKRIHISLAGGVIDEFRKCHSNLSVSEE
jgi:hypothetical protein